MLYLIEKVGEGEDDSFLASYLIYSNFTQLSVSQREKKKKKKHKKKTSWFLNKTKSTNCS